MPNRDAGTKLLNQTVPVKTGRMVCLSWNGLMSNLIYLENAIKSAFHKKVFSKYLQQAAVNR